MFFVLLGAVFGWSLTPGQVPGPEGEVVHFRVESSSKTAVVDALVAEGLVSHPMLMRVYATWMTPGSDFEVRSHLLARGLSTRQLFQRLAGVGSRESVKITLPEGWSHRQMAVRLEEKQVCSELGFQAAVFDQKLLREVEVSGESAEGYLFPATYEFRVDTDPRDIVKRLVRETKKRLKRLKNQGAREKDLRTLSFDDHDVLILASIIERETGVGAERARVARVFLNRLLHPEGETGGRLQSDPTAGYGCLIEPLEAISCAAYTGEVVPEILDDGGNRYNTYRHAGLPPGPIANPGEAAISAVLDPASGQALYFVADGKGGHVFSESYSEHRVAIERLKAKK